MHPVLFSIGKVTIYTYGLFTALGFLIAIQIAKAGAKREGESQENIMDISFLMIVSAIIGARLFYVLINLDDFKAHPLEIFEIWNGGLVFYGGFLVAVSVGFFYLRKRKIPVWKTADIFAPAMAAGHCVGRLGCLCAGCCYGHETHVPWAITFHNADSLAPLGVAMHPTQLYSSVGNLLLFFFLIFFRKFKKFDGQVFWVYVFSYALMRSFIEIFRGDFRGGFLFNLFSVSQTIGFTMAALAVLMLLLLRYRAKR